MNASDLAKYFKNSKETRTVVLHRITLEKSIIVSDGLLMVMIDKQDEEKVFNRRDVWPVLPPENSGTIIYRPGDPVGIKGEVELGTKMEDLWFSYIDIMKLTPLTIQQWLFVSSNGHELYLLQSSLTGRIYLQRNQVDVLTCCPLQEKWFAQFSASASDDNKSSYNVLLMVNDKLTGIIAPVYIPDIQQQMRPFAEYDVMAMEDTNIESH
jgi:hypothetical protein